MTDIFKFDLTNRLISQQKETVTSKRNEISMRKEMVMNNGALGKVYRNGDTIVRQGDAGSAMYVIQDGEVEVFRSHNGSTVRLAVLGQGEFFGEISLFSKEERSATVRALGDVRVLTVDRKIFMRRLQEDLTLAFQVFQTMAGRIKDMNSEMVVLKSAVVQ